MWKLYIFLISWKVTVFDFVLKVSPQLCLNNI
jgi:hypothetical protein